MTENMKKMIYYLREIEGIDMLDIGKVKKYALNRKMYELIVFINSNLTEYIEFVKKENNRAQNA